MQPPYAAKGYHSRIPGKLRRNPLGLVVLVLALSASSSSRAGQEIQAGPCGDQALIGNSLPGDWRPFADDSPWNTPIPAEPPLHPDSDTIVATLVSGAPQLRLSNSYMPPLWVVNSRNMQRRAAWCSYPFDTWDQNWDRVTEATVPIAPGMYGEGTSDGHIIIVDPFLGLAWEMSKFTGYVDEFVACGTFNVWDLEGRGFGDPNEGRRWGARGGRGSGFPIIAGLVRPEELAAGAIRHALVFTFPTNRADFFLAPAVRSDGNAEGTRYPIEGMRLQLDPSLTDADFDAWGLTREGRILARALQTYGMFDGDNGGAMSLQVQLLGESAAESRARWDASFPGFYDAIGRIPTSALRVVYTGEPTTEGGARSTVVQPLVLPLGGDAGKRPSVTISTPTRNAQVTYTLDGSEPTEASTAYAGPFSLEGPATVKARAFKSGKKPSPVTRASFDDCADAGTGPASPPAPAILPVP